jgi:hypothetical protein
MKYLLLLLVACSNDAADKQLLPIGSPCTDSSQCGTGRYFCDKDHPGGYCKLPCHKDADCPSATVCAGAGTIAPGECHKTCNLMSECRAGYACKMAPADATHAYCDVPEEMGDGGTD